MVELAKVSLRPGAGNLVNALLRAVITAKEKGTLPAPAVEGDERARARALATVHSHPVVRGTVRVWDRYGYDGYGSFWYSPGRI